MLPVNLQQRRLPRLLLLSLLSLPALASAAKQKPDLETFWAAVEPYAQTRSIPKADRKRGLETFIANYPQKNPHLETARAYLSLLEQGREPIALLEPKKVPNGMVQVPAGEFFSGCSKGDSCEKGKQPGKKVSLDSFSIDLTEVTLAEYRACVRAGACSGRKLDGIEFTGMEFKSTDLCNWADKDREHHPINCVDFKQAQAFCAWKGKRLPTALEWEKAARGTDGRIYPWGSAEPDCEKAVIGHGCGRNRTWAVGSKFAGASPYGALDMVGNVKEWVTHEDSGDMNAYKGGGFSWSEKRLAVRLKPESLELFNGTWRIFDLGFRCAKSDAAK